MDGRRGEKKNCSEMSETAVFIMLNKTILGFEETKSKIYIHLNT